MFQKSEKDFEICREAIYLGGPTMPLVFELQGSSAEIVVDDNRPLSLILGVSMCDLN